MRRALASSMVAGLGFLLACGESEPGDGTGDAGSSGAPTGGETTDAAGGPASGTTEGSSGPTVGTDAGTDGGSADAGTDGGSTGDTSTGDEPACGDDVTPGGAVVVTTSGAVEGVDTGSSFTFLGIPYAEPPLGDRRWAPPEPIACWAGIAPAQEYGSRCTQLETAEGPVVGDEDCLFLNVWTPAPDGGSRPVMVFIHGGGNTLGHGSNPLFDGTNLAQDHDVVVVTLNYRLGALGWLTHPTLAAQSPDGVSGNYGLLDQIEALRWVRDNIERFGGDASRVTIFGESAGAVNVCALVGSPLAADLFDGAIVQSGTCQQRSLAAYGSQIADEWADNAGCDTADVPAVCLRALDPLEVAMIEPRGYPNVGGLEGQGWGPVVDGWVLPATTLDAMAAGTHNDVRFMVGANADETARDAPPIPDEASYVALVQAAFGTTLGNLVLSAYPASDYDSPADAYVALTTDVKFVCGARTAARTAAAQQEAVYRYHFAYDGYDAPGDPAAFHGLELVYVFGNFDTVYPPPFVYTPNADDLAMADAMAEAWTSFARTGVPATPTVTWEAYDPVRDNVWVADVPSAVADGVRTEQCDFWASLL